MEIPMLKIRRGRDYGIFNMGIPILVRWHLYIEMAPRHSEHKLQASIVVIYIQLQLKIAIDILSWKPNIDLWLPWPCPSIFKVKFWKKLYLRNGWTDWMLGWICDINLWPHPWSWPWILKVIFWNVSTLCHPRAAWIDHHFTWFPDAGC